MVVCFSTMYLEWRWLQFHMKSIKLYLVSLFVEILASLFYSAIASISVFMALSTVFHSISFPNNSLFSDSVLLSYLCLLVLSTLYLFLKVSYSPDIIPSGWLGSKHQLTNFFCLSPLTSVVNTAEQTQKFQSNLLGNHLSMITSVELGVHQDIALHAFPTARNYLSLTCMRLHHSASFGPSL